MARRRRNPAPLNGGDRASGNVVTAGARNGPEYRPRRAADKQPEPVPPCPCGCGRPVKPEKIGGHVRRFASPECKARFHFAARKLGEALIGDRVFTVSTVEDYLARGGLTASYTTASMRSRVGGNIGQAPQAHSAAEKSARAGPTVRRGANGDVEARAAGPITSGKRTC